MKWFLLYFTDLCCHSVASVYNAGNRIIFTKINKLHRLKPILKHWSLKGNVYGWQIRYFWIVCVLCITFRGKPCSEETILNYDTSFLVFFQQFAVLIKATSCAAYSIFNFLVSYSKSLIQKGNWSDWNWLIPHFYDRFSVDTITAFIPIPRRCFSFGNPYLDLW